MGLVVIGYHIEVYTGGNEGKGKNPEFWHELEIPIWGRQLENGQKKTNYYHVIDYYTWEFADETNPKNDLKGTVDHNVDAKSIMTVA